MKWKKQTASVFVWKSVRKGSGNRLKHGAATSETTEKIILRICWTCLFLNSTCQGIRKTRKGQPESDADFIGIWLRIFLFFWRITSKAIQRFAETRSHTKCEKGVGNSQQASANPKTLTGLPCLLLSEMNSLLWVDGNNRQEKRVSYLQNWKTTDFMV